MLTMIRRITLTACFLALAGFAGLCAADTPDRANAAAADLQAEATRAPVGALSGTWLINGNPEPTCGVPPFVNFTTIDPFGMITNVDPAVGTAVGQARRVAPNSFAASFFGFIDPQTTYAVYSILELAGAGGLNATFDVTVSDLSGNALCTYSGTLTGARLASN